MTVNRDKKTDIKQTNLLILKNKKPKFSGESWLGHTKDCGIIDHELLDGATRDELVKRSGRSTEGVDGHIQHLKFEHGLKISKIDNTYKFDFYNAKSNKILLKEDLICLMNIDDEIVKKYSILKLENKDGVKKWYSIGIETPKKEGEEVISLNNEKGFALSLLNKKLNDFVDFGSGFKILEIKKFLSE